MFRRGARRRSCRARETRRLEVVRSIEATTVSRTSGRPGGQAQLSWAQRSGGGTPPYRRTRQIRSLRLTLGLAITAVEDDGSKSTSGAASCCHTGSTVGVTEPSPMTASRVWRGFFPRFPPSQPEDFHVTIILTDKTLKQAYRGGGQRRWDPSTSGAAEDCCNGGFRDRALRGTPGATAEGRRRVFTDGFPHHVEEFIPSHPFTVILTAGGVASAAAAGPQIEPAP